MLSDLATDPIRRRSVFLGHPDVLLATPFFGMHRKTAKFQHESGFNILTDLFEAYLVLELGEL